MSESPGGALDTGAAEVARTPGVPPHQPYPPEPDPVDEASEAVVPGFRPALVVARHRLSRHRLTGS